MDDGIATGASSAPGRGLDQTTEDERRWLAHMTRFGSAGYPVRKLRGGRWSFDAAFGVGGTPVVYATRREAMAAAERFEACLIDKRAGRWS